MILLDTHALVWWVEFSPRLSNTARQAIATERQSGRIGISAFSCWQIALLVSRGKLSISNEINTWLAAIEALNRICFIPVDHAIAVRSVYLPAGLHDDPADRIIVATAMMKNIPIVTVDTRIRAYPHVQTIW
ncbi:type II toxin-antitoxin system VapC family toxin [Duganella callida]|uniref:Type II toxin-antitoxin system VapC family toxin n=1 Tax=Duganella callida TaxID=2561932 RepID=A0A4Y9SGR0_9BURK|nr:type II toxin-antitoxin system VapC family toxin [Duganella callida]TFW23417.1 type II toxin-antitoxin system VapC family toxin [Duganella callida]